MFNLRDFLAFLTFFLARYELILVIVSYKFCSSLLSPMTLTNLHRIVQPSIIITRFRYRFELKERISLLVFNKELDKSKCFLLTIQGVSQQKYTNVELQIFMFVCVWKHLPSLSVQSVRKFKEILEFIVSRSNLTHENSKHTSKLLYYINVSVYKLISTCTTNTAMNLVLFSVEEEKCIDKRICCTLYFPQNFPTKHLRTAMRNSTRIFTRTIHRLSLYTKLRATQYIKILPNDSPNKRSETYLLVFPLLITFAFSMGIDRKILPNKIK